MTEIAAAGPAMSRAHSMPLRVYYEDTDAAGIVYYANYLKFAERGRTEMMRGLGFGHRRLAEEAGIAFAVRRCTADYLGAARLDDSLTVETRIEALRGATLTLRQAICRDGSVLARLDVLVACIGSDGRPRRLPAPLRAAVADWLGPDTPANIGQKTHSIQKTP